MSAKFNDAMPAVHRGPWAPAGMLAIAVAAPWLWPFTDGPSANTWPLMFSWAVLAGGLLLAGIWPQAGPALRAALPLGWLLAGLVSAMIGLAQWFGVAPSVSLISPAQLAEAYGNLRQRNQFASLMGIGLLALLHVAGPRPRAWCFAAAALLAFANAASASRTGLLQWVLIALATLAPGVSPAPRRIAAAAVAAYVAAALLLPEALVAWRGTDAANAFHRAAADMGCASRLVLWSNVAHLIGERPWTGWGAGELDYAHYATLYGAERFCAILDNAHNLPLHLAVEFGLPAALLACAAVLVLALRARPWAARRPDQLLAWGVLLVIGLHSLVEYPLWYGPFQLAVLQSLWLLRTPSQAGSVRLRWPAVAAGAFLAAGLLFAASEYERVSQAYKAPHLRRPEMRMDPVASAGRVFLFRDHLEFADLSVTPLSRANAVQVHEQAGRMLHYSPEPGVIEKRIESAMLLDRTDDALWHAERYRAAFPAEYREWVARGAQPLRPPQP